MANPVEESIEEERNPADKPLPFTDMNEYNRAMNHCLKQSNFYID
jgi:hypothetical protein